MQKDKESKVIVLDEGLLYGRGSHKECYLHPLNDRLCIKVPYNDGGKIDLEREIKYIELLKFKNKDYSILPKYIGKVQTSRGRGYIFELIKDYTGEKSLTLEDFLKDEILLSDNLDLVTGLLKQLRTNLLQNEIITMGLFPENIIFQRISNNKYRIRIVNDMGSAALIPLEYYFSFFAIKKVLRRWQRFINVVRNDYSNKYINKLLENIDR